MKTFTKVMAGFVLGAIVFTILALLLIAPAMAAGTTANITLIAPTSYTDGSPLPESDIAKYTIHWQGQTRDITTKTTMIVVPCGSAIFTATVTTKPTAKYPDSTSAHTNPITYNTGISCLPNAPAMTVE